MTNSSCATRATCCWTTSASKASSASCLGTRVVIGAGGLGSPVGDVPGHRRRRPRLTLVDHDTVDLTNLQRQIAHNRSRVGQPKAESAAHSRSAPSTPTRSLQAIVRRADDALLDELVPQCRRGAGLQRQLPHPSRRQRGLRAPWQAAGQRRSHRLRRPDLGLRHAAGRDAPCYACLFPPEAAFEEVACATMGVFAPLVGIIGTMQAAEALKLLAGSWPVAGRPAADAGRPQR